MLEIDPQILARAKAWRQDIHTHPELAFCETRTSSIVKQELETCGLEVIDKIAKTGIVAVLKRGDGPKIGLRADMDALPIHEATNLNYASKTTGCMHACGHDGHTSMLLGAVRQICALPDLRGTVYFIFQPAEEAEGGAQAMIEDGLFERFPMDAIYGLHNMPGIPVGTFVVKDGPMAAAFARFNITITGPGGHGAMPETTRDPIVAGAALVMALQTIPSRNIKPLEPSVVTVGAFHAGEAENVIPGEVQIKGSCRSFSNDVALQIEQRIREISAGIAATYGLEIKVDYEHGYPSVINSKAESEIVAEVARSLVGDEHVITDPDPFMGSEDFSYFLQAKPGCYFIIGNGEDCTGLHSPTYNFNDDALKYGIGFWTALVKHQLGHP
ncbi:MAG TPA: amidohydrolase [Hellea balneolensis]|uniref:Amidohydrolase n=1 Tax=Hellea balneolensis TaxID=287478 RepID=A0A7C5QS89_9PROT|nr:amidohydrolase [Hellea balneolensis]